MRTPCLYRLPLLSSPLLSLSLLGCPVPPQDTDPPDNQDTDGTPATTGGEPNVDETGPVEDTSDELLNGCLIDSLEGKFGFVHQCAGGVAFAVKHDSGVLVGDSAFFFGFGDYENPPSVMACCDIFEAGDPPPPQPHEWACYKDMVETFCEESIVPAVVAEFLAQGFDPENVSAFQEHMMDNLEDCNSAFFLEIDGWDLLAPEGPLGGALDLEGPEWQINETFTHGIADTSQIINPVIIIDQAGFDMENLLIPVIEDDPIICGDNDFNDGQAFIVVEENPEFMLFLDEGDGSLLGPEYNNGPLLGNFEFASIDTSCTGPWCSYIAFSENVSDWTLHNLALYSSTTATISDETIYVTADWFHIELAGPVQAEERGTDFFQVSAGEAVFLLSTVIEGEAHHLIVRNGSSILIEREGDNWETSTFALQYYDSESDGWTLMVGGAEWVPST